jgi:hypothetical protein
VTNKIFRGIGWLLAFLIVQVGIATVLKIAAYPHWRVDGMVLAAALPVSSTFLLMRVFAFLPSHLSGKAMMGGLPVAMESSPQAVAIVNRTKVGA